MNYGPPVTFGNDGIVHVSGTTIGTWSSTGLAMASGMVINFDAGTVAACGARFSTAAGSGFYIYAGAYPAMAKGGTQVWWGGDGVFHSAANFYADGASFFSGLIDITTIAAGSPNFKFTKTTDTPATTFTAHVPSTDPAFYIECREAAAGATPYYIFAYT